MKIRFAPVPTSALAAAAALVFGLSPALPLAAQNAEAQADSLELEEVWTITGGPYGSKRKLDPTIAVTAETVFIDAMVPKGKRDHEIVRSFGARDGRPGAVIQHPDGEAFEGLGDDIAANARFTVTAISGKAQFGRGGELLVYDTATLKLLHRIKSPRGAASYYFASTGIALVGSRILAAVPQTNDNISTAWVFDAATGKVLLTIDEPDLPDPKLGKPRRSVFGRSVAMNDRYIAVAANGRTGRGGLYAKSIVYVFDARDGSLLHRITSPGSPKASLFGAGLAMSQERLFVTGLDEVKLDPEGVATGGDINWPVGKLHAFNLATGALEYTLSDTGAPETLTDIGAGKEGWGLGNAISADGPYLISGLPDWSGAQKNQGGFIIFDERTGEQLLRYAHESGPAYGRFGKAIAARGGLIAVMGEYEKGGPGAERVVLYRLKERAE